MTDFEYEIGPIDHAVDRATKSVIELLRLLGASRFELEYNADDDTVRMSVDRNPFSNQPIANRDR